MVWWFGGSFVRLFGRFVVLAVRLFGCSGCSGCFGCFGCFGCLVVLSFGCLVVRLFWDVFFWCLGFEFFFFKKKVVVFRFSFWGFIFSFL